MAKTGQKFLQVEFPSFPRRCRPKAQAEAHGVVDEDNCPVPGFVCRSVVTVLRGDTDVYENRPIAGADRFERLHLAARSARACVLNHLGRIRMLPTAQFEAQYGITDQG